MAKKRTRKSTKIRNAGKFWSSSAVKFLTSKAGRSTTKRIASRLGRTTKAVSRKAEKLGISLATY